MTMILLAIPLLIVLYILTQSGETVMTDPLAQVRADEALYQAGVEQAAKTIGQESPPLYCPGCKTYEDLTLFRGDRLGFQHAIETWYEDHKPHFLPANNQPQKQGAPGS